MPEEVAAVDEVKNKNDRLFFPSKEIWNNRLICTSKDALITILFILVIFQAVEDTEAVAIGDVVLDAEVVAMEAEVKIINFLKFCNKNKNHIVLLQVVMVAGTDMEVVVEAMAEAEEVSNINLRINLVKS